MISHNLEALFPGMEVIEHALFRVTRDTDYDVSDEADDLRQAVEDEIRRRRFGEVIRLELEGELEPRLRERLVSLLDIGPEQVYEVNRIGMDDLSDIAGVSGFSDLRYPPFAGVTQTRLQAPEGQTIDLLGAIREGDILVHHPYDSFTTSVESFVRQAVNEAGRQRRPARARRGGADPARRRRRARPAEAHRGPALRRGDPAIGARPGGRARGGRGPQRRRLRHPAGGSGRPARPGRGAGAGAAALGPHGSHAEGQGGPGDGTTPTRSGSRG